MSTPPTNSWAATFSRIDQDKVLSKFAGLLTGASAAERSNHACANADVAFLIPQADFSIKLVHHLHFDLGNLSSPGTNELWGLLGGDSHAPTLIIPAVALDRVKKTYKAPTWDAFQSCASVDKVAALKSDSQGPNDSQKTPGGTFKPYSWLTPVPAFLVKVILECRSTDPLTLCFAVSKAIMMHATAAASKGSTPGTTGPVATTVKLMGHALLYIPQLLWIIHLAKHTSDTSLIPPELALQLPLSTALATWGLGLHQRLIGQPLNQQLTTTTHNAVSTDVGLALGRVATAMATMNSQRATAAAAAVSSASKTGFPALPVITQRLILHASSRLDTGRSVRSRLTRSKSCLPLATPRLSVTTFIGVYVQKLAWISICQQGFARPSRRGA